MLFHLQRWMNGEKKKNSNMNFVFYGGYRLLKYIEKGIKINIANFHTYGVESTQIKF